MAKKDPPSQTVFTSAAPVPQNEPLLAVAEPVAVVPCCTIPDHARLIALLRALLPHASAKAAVDPHWLGAAIVREAEEALR